jgi:hypothetical protein
MSFSSFMGGRTGLSLLAAACAWYDARLSATPLRTRMATASLLGACGDVVAQRADGEKHDWARSAERFGSPREAPSQATFGTQT